MENYGAVAWVQIALDLGAAFCWPILRAESPPAEDRRAAHATLWLAALCPFTAVYATTPLTEAPTLFVLSLALWAAARFQEKPGWAKRCGLRLP